MILHAIITILKAKCDFSYIKNDKKNTSNYLNLIIVDKIGKAMIVKKENRK